MKNTLLKKLPLFTVLCVFYILAMISVITLDAPSGFTALSIVLLTLIVAAIVLIELFKLNRLLLIAPVLLLIVLVSIFQSIAVVDVGFDVANSSLSALGLGVVAALVVGLVFAFKGKKWGAVLATVMLGLELSSNVTTLLGVTFLDEMLEDGQMLMQLSIVLAYVSIILCCIPALCNEKDKAIEKVDTPVEAE